MGEGTGEAFVDTDVIIRLLTGDDPTKQAQARALFIAVEAGDLTITAADVAIFEAVYVLGSPRLYRVPRQEIRDLLTAVLRPASFKLERKSTLLHALDLYATTQLPFGDAMIVAAMREAGATEVYSFDAHFDRIPGITRREPSTR